MEFCLGPNIFLTTLPNTLRCLFFLQGEKQKDRHYTFSLVDIEESQPLSYIIFMKFIAYC
jgi:hypothetical protein